MRRLIAVPCQSATLLATVDAAPGTGGVLIVSGGNEVRVGAHRGMATLAAQLATAGVPVFRYDRRGVGDSDGSNEGWESGAPDLAAAAAAFRREQPQLTRIIGFGNCDGAATLALFGRDAGLDALVLANPWLGHQDALPPPAAVRAHYARRLLDRATWARLVRGGIDLAAFARGLRRSVAGVPQAPLAPRLAAGMAALPTTLVLADGDRTAQHFAAAWASPVFAHVDARLVRLATASHSFVGHTDDLATLLLEVVAAG